MLLDALVGLGSVEQAGRLTPCRRPCGRCLVEDSPETLLPMILHDMNLVRTLVAVGPGGQAGEPAARAAEHSRGRGRSGGVHRGHAQPCRAPSPTTWWPGSARREFRHLLDVGGASGTWTLAFLRAVPDARATIFDLPDAIQQARQPHGRRAAWPSASGWWPAISTATTCPAAPTWPGSAQSPTSTRASTTAALFEKIHAALVPGGRILIRDVVMDADHAQPVDGALFAINMLVNTASGGTFTFDEYAEDLQAAGFRQPALLVKDPWMNSVVEAGKPDKP